MSFQTKGDIAHAQAQYDDAIRRGFNLIEAIAATAKNDRCSTMEAIIDIAKHLQAIEGAMLNYPV